MLCFQLLCVVAVRAVWRSIQCVCLSRHKILRMIVDLGLQTSFEDFGFGLEDCGLGLGLEASGLGLGIGIEGSGSCCSYIIRK